MLHKILITVVFYDSQDMPGLHKTLIIAVAFYERTVTVRKIGAADRNLMLLYIQCAGKCVLWRQSWRRVLACDYARELISHGDSALRIKRWQYT